MNATVSNANVRFENGSGGTLTGSSNSVSVGSNVVINLVGNLSSLSVTGSGASINVTGINDVVAMSRGVAEARRQQHRRDLREMATPSPKVGGDTVMASGKQDAVTITGTGNVIAISNATIMVADGAEAVIVGSNDIIVSGANASIKLVRQQRERDRQWLGHHAGYRRQRRQRLDQQRLRHAGAGQQ